VNRRDKSPRTRESRRGVALYVVLVATCALALIAVELAMRARADSSLTRRLDARRQLGFDAQSGLAVARALLSGREGGYVHGAQDWALPVELDGGALKIRLHDESGKLDVGSLFASDARATRGGQCLARLVEVLSEEWPDRAEVLDRVSKAITELPRAPATVDCLREADGMTQ
jgi:type II secretory pathway component PulK